MKRVILNIVLVLVLLFVGAAVGYYYGYQLGFKDGNADQTLVNPLEKATDAADSYKNPFKYQNPFDQIKLNPFAK
jgi:flagellar basal body-associated protein FliL